MAATAKTQVIDAGGVLVHQLLCGRELAGRGRKASADPMTQRIWDFAESMRNFVYLVVDPSTLEALVLDGCWDVEGIFAYASQIGVRIVGAVFTHSHFDHAGGHVPPSMTGGLPVVLPGAQTFAERGVPLWAGASDAKAIADQCGLAKETLAVAAEGAEIRVGRTRCTIFTTPGHTVGSVCLHVPCGGAGGGSYTGLGGVVPAARGTVLTGDTLFVDSCGRTDLPGSDGNEMLRSLSRLCQGLPDECVICPGHDYSHVPHTTIRETKNANQMVQMGLRMWGKAGDLPPYQECLCQQRGLSAAAKALLGGAEPAVVLTAFGGGEVRFFGVPEDATVRDCCQVVFALLQHGGNSTSKRSRRLRRPEEVSLACAAGEAAGQRLPRERPLRALGPPPAQLTLLTADLPRQALPSQHLWFPLGSEVVLGGLQGAKDLNGCIAEVRNFNGAKGRYAVRLKQYGAEKFVKPGNLSRAAIPAVAPELEVEELPGEAVEEGDGGPEAQGIEDAEGAGGASADGAGVEGAGEGGTMSDVAFNSPSRRSGSVASPAVEPEFKVEELLGAASHEERGACEAQSAEGAEGTGGASADSARVEGVGEGGTMSDVAFNPPSWRVGDGAIPAVAPELPEEDEEELLCEVGEEGGVGGVAQGAGGTEGTVGTNADGAGFEGAGEGGTMSDVAFNPPSRRVGGGATPAVAPELEEDEEEDGAGGGGAGEGGKLRDFAFNVIDPD